MNCINLNINKFTLSQLIKTAMFLNTYVGTLNCDAILLTAGVVKTLTRWLVSVFSIEVSGVSTSESDDDSKKIKKK